MSSPSNLSKELQTWYTEIQHQKIPGSAMAGGFRGRALLKVTGSGNLRTLTAVDEASLGFWRKLGMKFGSFFGWGDFALSNVLDVIQQSNLSDVNKEHLTFLLTEKIHKYHSRRLLGAPLPRENLAGQVQLLISKLWGEKQKPYEGKGKEEVQIAPQMSSKNASQEVEIFQYPLVGKIGTPSEIMKPLEDFPPNDNYKIFDPFFQVCRIRGDGNCMFRSFATTFLKSRSGDELDFVKGKIRKFLEENQGLLEEKQKQELQNDLNNMETSIECIKTGAPIDLVMANADLSDSWVKILRFIASIQLRKTPFERLGPMIQTVKEHFSTLGIEVKEDFPMELIREYLEGIQDADPRKNPIYGGQIELKELCSFFNVKVGIISVAQSNSESKKRVAGTTLEVPLATPGGEEMEVVKWGELENPDSPSQLSEEALSCKLFLILEGQHYNAAFLKPEIQQQSSAT